MPNIELSDNAKQAIEWAKQHMDRDPVLAAYMLRDLPEVEVLGLRNLAWAMCRLDNWPSKNDVLYLIELLEAGELPREEE